MLFILNKNEQIVYLVLVFFAVFTARICVATGPRAVQHAFKLACNRSKKSEHSQQECAISNKRECKNLIERIIKLQKNINFQRQAGVYSMRPHQFNEESMQLMSLGKKLICARLWQFAADNNAQKDAALLQYKIEKVFASYGALHYPLKQFFKTTIAGIQYDMKSNNYRLLIDRLNKDFAKIYAT